MANGYNSRKPMQKASGIFWNVTTRDPMEGLHTIVDELRDRYNPVMSDQKFELHALTPLPIPDVDQRVRIPVTLDGNYYGDITIVLSKDTVDTSTWERFPALQYLVFFNMHDESYHERNHFLAEKDRTHVMPRFVPRPKENLPPKEVPAHFKKGYLFDMEGDYSRTTKLMDERRHEMPKRRKHR